jgi:hypothetical protein
LRREQINFHLRVRENFRVTNARGQVVAVKRLFRTRVDEVLSIAEPRRMWGEDWYFSGCYLGSGEYLILVSPNFSAEAVAEYARRWEVETLFAALKTRGFNLEQTHLVDHQRLSKLLALLALAFCWCHRIGEWLHTQRPLKLRACFRRSRSALVACGYEQPTLPLRPYRPRVAVSQTPDPAGQTRRPEPAD